MMCSSQNYKHVYKVKIELKEGNWDEVYKKSLEKTEPNANELIISRADWERCSPSRERGMSKAVRVR